MGKSFQQLEFFFIGVTNPLMDNLYYSQTWQYYVEQINKDLHNSIIIELMNSIV